MVKRVKGRKTIDYNALARKGIYFCASCGKRMNKNSSGHCAACRRRGVA